MAGKPWERTERKLARNHSWKSSPGYQIFVANGGELRFDIPVGWVIVADSTSFKFHDQQPPDDECVIELTINRLPPADYSEFPLEAALSDVLGGGYDGPVTRGTIAYEKRGLTRLAWGDVRYVDQSVDREAIGWTLIGLRGQIQVLVTMAYWVDDVPQFEPAWKELVRSIKLGEQVDMLGNPTRVLH